MNITFSVTPEVFELLPAMTFYRLKHGNIFELSWLQFSLSFDTIKPRLEE